MQTFNPAMAERNDGSYGLHVIKAPSGAYIYRGSVPTCLADEVKPTKSDIMGQRWHLDANGEAKSWKFPVFDGPSEAMEYARYHGCDVISCQDLQS